MTALTTAGVLALGGVQVREATTPPAPSPVAIEACRTANDLRGTLREILFLFRGTSTNPEAIDSAIARLGNVECNP